MNSETLTVIQRTSGWRLVDFKELKQYRDLFFFLVFREIKVLYAQTILGLSWAIIQPTVQIILFTIIFGNIAKLSSEGVPYVLFSTVAIVPWTYMASAMQGSSQSLIANQAMLGKLYVPRLIFPLVPILAKLIDFFISMCIVVGVAIYFHVSPTLNLLFLPVFILMMMCISAGTGMWMAAMAIRFRDVRHAMGFVMRMLMYSAPIVYSAAHIDENTRLIYSINPIVGVIEGFRAALLGTPMPWQYIWPGMITTVILIVSGAMYFKRMERIFADVI